MKLNIDDEIKKSLDGLLQILFVSLEQALLERTNAMVSKTDLGTEITKQIEEFVDRKMKAANLPDSFIPHRSINWDGYELSANVIKRGSIKNFTSTGIQDAADQIELTVTDQAVIVENMIVASSAEIKDNMVANHVAVQTLAVEDQIILTEKVGKQFISLIKDNISIELNSRKIDVVENPIYANGREVLTEDTLGPSVINSNIRKLGRLQELNVAGMAQFNDTLFVTNDGKIGINTTDPEGALTVWDDDADLTVRRHKKKNMYVGTMRDVDLSLGVNGDVVMAMRRDKSVEMQKIVLNGLPLSVSDMVPNHAGAPGEIIIMSNAQVNEPWAYRCVNGSWVAIK